MFQQTTRAIPGNTFGAAMSLGHPEPWNSPLSSAVNTSDVEKSSFQVSKNSKGR
jgi:hypothetical protein